MECSNGLGGAVGDVRHRSVDHAMNHARQSAVVCFAMSVAATAVRFVGWRASCRPFPMSSRSARLCGLLVVEQPCRQDFAEERVI